MSRRFLEIATVGFGLLCFVDRSFADYPERQITIVVPYNPGGAVDIQARLLADHFRKLWHQNVLVENRTGASGVTGSAAVARSVPDGYTLVMGTSASHAVSVVTMPALSYAPLRDFTPI